MRALFIDPTFFEPARGTHQGFKADAQHATFNPAEYEADMDGLQITTVEAIGRAPDTLAHCEKPNVRVAPRIQAALAALLEAFDYAQDLSRSPWDLAVELSCLRRLDLSKSDLRWLAGKALVEHAIEVTLPGDADRTFRQSARPLFCRKACFVLTPQGAQLAREVCGKTHVDVLANSRQPTAPAWLTPEPLSPKWDRNRQELKVGSIMVKHFKVPAANQEAILAAFEEEAWPPRVDDPLPPHGDQSSKRRLQETIKSLNRNQKRPLIRFLGDGSGQGVCWEFCSQRDASRRDV